MTPMKGRCAVASNRMTVKKEYRELYPWLKELSEGKKRARLSQELAKYATLPVEIRDAGRVAEQFRQGRDEVEAAMLRLEEARTKALALRAKFGLDQIPCGDLILAITEQMPFGIDPAKTEQRLTHEQWLAASKPATGRVLSLADLFRLADNGTIPRDVVVDLIEVDCKPNVELEKPKAPPKPKRAPKRASAKAKA